MSISNVLIALWFILVGVAWLGWITIDNKFLGLLAFVIGILIIVEGVRPLWRK